MTNAELCAALAWIDDRLRHTGTGSPLYRPYAEHGRALLAEQLRRSAFITITTPHPSKERTMNQVVVEKARLIETIKANRTKHLEAFEEAAMGYRKAVAEMLENFKVQLEQQMATPIEICNAFGKLEEPKNYLREYDRILQMLDMSVEDQIILAEHEFQQYVMDEWNWSRGFQGLVRTYSGIH